MQPPDPDEAGPIGHAIAGPDRTTEVDPEATVPVTMVPSPGDGEKPAIDRHPEHARDPILVTRTIRATERNWRSLQA